MLPDPVLALPGREKTPGAWMDHADARDADLMQVPDVGAFVRALLPVHLTEGHQITYGVWLAVHPSQLPDLFDVWQKPAYADLQLDGWLGLFQLTVTELAVGEAGSLTLGFDSGAELVVTPHQQFEAWSLTGHGVDAVTVGPGGEPNWEH